MLLLVGGVLLLTLLSGTVATVLGIIFTVLWCATDHRGNRG